MPPMAPPGLSSPSGCYPQPTGPGLQAEASRLLTQPPGLVAEGAVGSPGERAVCSERGEQASL